MVLSLNNTSTTVLDGFTITGGNANSPTSISVPAYVSSETGSGLSMYSSYGQIRNCFFYANNVTSQSLPGGGAIFINNCQASISNCAFIANTSNSVGVAIGTAYCTSPVSITNCTFYSNSGQSEIANQSSSPAITNCIIWSSLPYSFYNYSATPTVTYSLVKGGYAGTGNLNTDPLFFNSSDPDGADNIPGTSDDGLRLQLGSPAINMGNNAAATGIATDITRGPRIQYTTVDMGAYESPYMTYSITSNVSVSSVCAGATLPVAYTAVGTYTAGNIFTAQLSNAAGSFASPVSIGMVTATASSTIMATVPASTPSGSGYRVRVISSNPAFSVTDNGTDITISTVPVTPVITASGSTTVCTGSSVTLSVPFTSGYTYSWSPGGQTTASIAVNTSGVYTVTTTNTGGCSATSAPVRVAINPPAVLYVDSSRATSGNGASWSTAYKELRDALTDAASCSNINTIYIARGTYKPTADGSRDSAFTILRGGLKVYGGYPSGGGNRDTAANHTILSGDIGTAGTSTDNSYHVVVIAGLGASADSLVLDGLTITSGNATGTGSKMYNGATLYQNEGAGLYLHSNNGAGGKIAVRNCTFTANNATAYGGGFYNQLSSPTIFNCVLKGNTVTGGGGGMFNYNTSTPLISNCSFAGNIATGDGGGMLNLQCSPIIDKCIFSDNIANTINSSRGGGMCNNNASPVIKNTVFTSNYGNYGGGLHIFNSSSPQISNCVITNNRARYGGGIYASDNFSSPVFTNCTITGNIADSYGQGILIWNNSHSYFRNSIIYNNDVYVDDITTATAYASYCITSLPGTGNINANPLFNNAADPDGADNIWGTADDGFHLQAASPALNTGSNAALPAGTTTDIAGAGRIQNGTIDMGAYENFYCRTGNALYVDASNTNSGNGNSWATAYQELRYALADAASCSNINTIYVAKGTYLPTNDTYRDSAFTILRGGLKIYGGYPTGGGTRNVAANRTILSGDIGMPGTTTDNSYHVLVLAGIDNSADSVVLDGCTLSNGTAGGSGTKLYNGQNADRSNGGGLYLLNNAAGSKIMIRNCSFTNNTGSNGGAVYSEASSPVFSNSNFVGNVAGNQGGAVYVYNHASPAFNHCFFGQNNAQDGGAISVFFYSPYSVSNCVFVQNIVSGRGGAIYVVNNSPATITNCTIANNNALYGGAMSFNVSSNTDIINAIAWGNTATAYPLFFNSNSFITVDHSLVQDGYTGTGNISSDPLFINSANAAGADNIFGTADDGLRLQAGSPAINTGSNAAVPAGITTDITGAGRIQDGTVDMGAYEGSVCPSFTTLYVDSSKAASGDGSSWATAFKELSSAMAAASQCNSITTINVAKGTYKPTNDTNRDSTFAILRGGLKIYGGYPTGGGTRDIVANTTVLSGDLGLVDDNTDNSYHIIIIANPGSNADSVLIDGFTITKANAKGTGTKLFNDINVSRNDGGGIYSVGQVNSKTVIRNCTITANTAFNGGGLNSQGGSSPTLINCTFANNNALLSGGGIHNNNCVSFIKGCSFNGNSASFLGGGMQNSNSSVVVDSCTFSNNTGNDGGGGVQNENSSPSFLKCIFINNFSQGGNSGGGMANFGGSPVVTNCMFIGNYSYENGTAVSNQNSQALFNSCTFSANYGNGGSVIYTYGSTPVVVTNSIIWGNYKVSSGNTTVSNPAIYNSGGANTTITYSDVQGGYSGTGNISSDPLFINSADADGADNIFGTADDGLHLQAGSPAINTGSNAAVPAGVPTDITGAARIQDGTVDMGAYEGSRCPSFTTLYVDSSIVSPGKGGSWATAFKTVQQALDASNSCSGVKQVWIKKGTYYPTTYPANCTGCAANGTARDYTFSLRDGLALYGGFAGTETDTTQRLAGNTTILSGDIGTPNNNSDNCYHVLLAINSNNRLNGLTVTGGNANDNGIITVAGQTIYHSNGGGMYEFASSSALFNCTFTANAANSEGGGMYTVYCSALRISNSRYLNNHSGAGGAIRLLYGNTSFVSVNSVYSGNTASSNDAGALSLVMGSGTDTLINNAFIKNVASGSTANNGGGAIVQESGTSSYILNNTFYADSAASNGGAIWFKSGGSNRYVYNNIFYKSYNGTANTDISLDGITTITAQSNNLYSTTNPLFINESNPAGADNMFGTADDGLALQPCSPAVNSGNNAAGSQPADIAGQLRIFNGTIDVGAYEYQAITTGSSLAVDGDNGNFTIQAGVNALLVPGCRIIAQVLPNSSSPLTGSLSAKIWIANTQPFYNGKSFVQRHYEFTPVANANTASARITLYATQGELTNFNNIPNNGNSLPAGPNDFGGIANLRIIKFSGQSSNGTGLPGTYSGAGMELDPDDNNIVWNNSLSRWEITFNVTGFSGFFITNNSGILPLTLLQFKGTLVNNKDVLLSWRTANEINTSHFELQRSTDGSSFTAIATIQAKGTAQSETDYTYTDKGLQPGLFYYRLLMTDKDGKATYSPVVAVQFKNSSLLTMYPVPAKDVIWLGGGTAVQTAKNAILMDIQGRVLQSIRITQWPQRIDISALVPGTYIVKLPEEKDIPFIKQ